MEKTFSDIMNRSSLDELEERLHDVCSNLEKEGYHNLDVAVALVKIANVRAEKEGPVLAEAFAFRQIEIQEKYLRGVAALVREVGLRLEAQKQERDRDKN